jgi:hypothetical protein
MAVDMIQKKFLYKMITENKDSNMKSSVDKIWKAYMAAPEAETFKRGKPIVDNKNHLVQILNELEKDNLVMFSEDDGSIVLI